jgi:hypothetical protein
MLPSYADIRALTDVEPIWFDHNGVPRYAPFHPRLLGVYDCFAVLAEIECQSCGRHLLIGEGRPKRSIHFFHDDPEVIEYSLAALAQHFVFGDPPRHDCPGAGETMACIERRIVEAWERQSDKWVRRNDFEIVFGDEMLLT